MIDEERPAQSGTGSNLLFGVNSDVPPSSSPQSTPSSPVAAELVTADEDFFAQAPAASDTNTHPSAGEGDAQHLSASQGDDVSLI